MADELAATAGGKIAAKKKMGHKCCAAASCNFRSDNRPDLSFHEFPKDDYLKKKWEVKMRRGDATFKNIANKFCCSAHFLPSDFKQSLTGHRRDLKRGAIPSVFKWAPVTNDPRGERLKLRNEMIAKSKSEQQTEHGPDEQQLAGSSISSYSSGRNMVVFGPRTLEEFINEKKEEAEQLKAELARAKEKEYIFTFGLERFSGSNEDINFYTGFPDYQTLIEFWKYIEPNSSRLTYYSYLKNSTDANFNNAFPYLNLTEKKFPGSSV
ncbi:Craniofacial development 2, partial [Paramuricea clavata]